MPLSQHKNIFKKPTHNARNVSNDNPDESHLALSNRSLSVMAEEMTATQNTQRWESLCSRQCTSLVYRTADTSAIKLQRQRRSQDCFDHRKSKWISTVAFSEAAQKTECPISWMFSPKEKTYYRETAGCKWQKLQKCSFISSIEVALFNWSIYTTPVVGSNVPMTFSYTDSCGETGMRNPKRVHFVQWTAPHPSTLRTLSDPVPFNSI